MLSLWHHPQTGETRLYLRSTATEAWISAEVPPGHQGFTDWVLWVRVNERLTLEKCQVRLELESRLRAWLLRRYSRRLYDLSFAELCEVACGGSVERSTAA